MVSKEVSSFTELWIDCLKTRLHMMTELEKRFATGIIAFYEYQHYLSEKQDNGARKLAIRLICERDVLYD